VYHNGYVGFSLNLHDLWFGRADASFDVMGAKIALVLLALIGSEPQAPAMAPLYDPVVLNIGINCQWQKSCEQRQRSAMTHAAQFIAETHPPLWRIHLCNRNARRGPARVDWVGFNGCIRNSNLAPPPHRRRHRQRRH
jgi:hypothetical protein